MPKHFSGIKRIFSFSLLTLSLAGGLLTSCRKGHPSWNTNLLAPVINASLSINNILPDSLVHANPDNSVTLVYNNVLNAVTTDSLVNMPDTTLVYGYGSIFTTAVNPGNSVIPTNNSSNSYNVGTVQLKKATLQAGFVDIEITSHVTQITDFTYSVPSATLNGNPLIMYLKVPAESGSTPGYIKKTYSLANYQLNLTGPSGNSYNLIQTSLRGIVDSAATHVAIIHPGDSVIIKATFYGIVPYYAQGYFGTTTKTFTGQSVFPLFNKIIAGSLAMQNINVNMLLENQFGVDARINISQLSSVNTRTGAIIPLTNAALINNNINVNRATQSNNPLSPVDASTQTFALNSSNSNILSWTDNLPNSINYALQVTTDPLGNVSGSNDFAYQGYGIQTNLNISIPLSLIATNLTLDDTLNVNFASAATAAQSIKGCTLNLYAANGFPFSAGMQIYLLNNQMKITDSLVAIPQIINAGITNGSGIVITPQNSDITVQLSAAQTQLLLNTSHIIILSRFNMGCATCLPQTYREIYSYYQLNVKVVANFDYDYQE